ncbi:MAG: TniB family NTP-binding protein [Pseudomonadales bacterium]|nr:TniB family NTP-binding protein [Pseudomonadales bacterium]MBO6596623.1 TniB family NTP-binding protein [Pseudomonadales bacterium]MBO6823388.1 TniB family NTP-binding protein [Pseudomonadales bacterium]
MEDAMTLCRDHGVARNYLCVGKSGTGKSTIKDMMRIHHPDSVQQNGLRMPILAVDTPALPTMKNFAEAILIKLNDPCYGRGTAMEKTARITNFVQQCGVELIIFDELQHFVDQGRSKSHMMVADWMKSLLDGVSVPTVLMGLERSAELLKVNEQLRRRFSQRLPLEAFDFDDDKDRGNFIGVMTNLLECFHEYPQIELSNVEAVKRLHFATNGVIDAMVRLLIATYEIVEHRKVQVIDPDLLAEAFRIGIWAEAPHNHNPFHKSFKWKRLDQPGMPFHEVLS